MMMTMLMKASVTLKKAQVIMIAAKSQPKYLGCKSHLTMMMTMRKVVQSRKARWP